MSESLQDRAMRLPRVRFTVRRMMVAVAAIAILCGAMMLAERRVRFGRIAEHHRLNARDYTFDKEEGMYMADPGSYWHKVLHEKYRRAASRPWLSVEPDPPWPDQHRYDRAIDRLFDR